MLHPQTQTQPLLFVLESREMLMNGAFKCIDTIPLATIMLLVLEGPTFTVQKMSTTKTIKVLQDLVEWTLASHLGPVIDFHN